MGNLVEVKETLERSVASECHAVDSEMGAVLGIKLTLFIVGEFRVRRTGFRRRICTIKALQQWLMKNGINLMMDEQKSGSDGINFQDSQHN